VANELEEAILSSIIKRSGCGVSGLLAFIRRTRRRQRFHDKIRADNAIEYWALAFDPRSRRTKPFIGKKYYSKTAGKKRKGMQVNKLKGARTFFFLWFFFRWLETTQQQTDALVSLSIFEFSNFFQLVAKEEKADMMIVW
jgi:hypothetical protein